MLKAASPSSLALSALLSSLFIYCGQPISAANTCDLIHQGASGCRMYSNALSTSTLLGSLSSAIQMIDNVYCAPAALIIAMINRQSYRIISSRHGNRRHFASLLVKLTTHAFEAGCSHVGTSNRASPATYRGWRRALQIYSKHRRRWAMLAGAWYAHIRIFYKIIHREQRFSSRFISLTASLKIFRVDRRRVRIKCGHTAACLKGKMRETSHSLSTMFFSCIWYFLIENHQEITFRFFDEILFFTLCHIFDAIVNAAMIISRSLLNIIFLNWESEALFLSSWTWRLLLPLIDDCRGAYGLSRRLWSRFGNYKMKYAECMSHAMSRFIFFLAIWNWLLNGGKYY